MNPTLSHDLTYQFSGVQWHHFRGLRPLAGQMSTNRRPDCYACANAKFLLRWDAVNLRPPAMSPHYRAGPRAKRAACAGSPRPRYIDSEIGQTFDRHLVQLIMPEAPGLGVLHEKLP